MAKSKEKFYLSPLKVRKSCRNRNEGKKKEIIQKKEAKKLYKKNKQKRLRAITLKEQ